MNDRSSPNGENRLLAALRPSDLPLVQPHLKRTVLEQGTLLQEQDDRVECAYFPLSGMISLLAVMGDGQAIETAIVGREGTVGAMSGLGPWHAASRAVVTGAGNRVGDCNFPTAGCREAKRSPQKHYPALQRDATGASATDGRV